MTVGRIQQSWDCSKYRLIVLSHLLSNDEAAGSLPKSAEAEKTWCCSESKALFNPRAAAAVLSYLMPCLAVPPQESALLPVMPLGPWTRTFSQICPECAATESQPNPGSNCGSDFSLHLEALGSILGGQSSRTAFLSHADTSALIPPLDQSLLPFF